MNPHSGTKDDNNIRKSKTIAAIPMAIIIITAALVSGLGSFMSNSYRPAIAQTDNATSTTGGGQFPCAPVETGGGGAGGQNNNIPGVLLHLNLALDALNAVHAAGANNVTASLEERGLMLDPGGPQFTEGGPEEEG